MLGMSSTMCVLQDSCTVMSGDWGEWHGRGLGCRSRENYLPSNEERAKTRLSDFISKVEWRLLGEIVRKMHSPLHANFTQRAIFATYTYQISCVWNLIWNHVF